MLKSSFTNPSLAAKELLLIAWDGSLPVKPQQIANDIGIKLTSTSDNYTDACKLATLYICEQVDTELFARELLIPTMIINYLIEKRKIFSLSVLSETLGVSEEVMFNRLQDMNWVPHDV